MSDYLAQILKLYLRQRKSGQDFPEPEERDILELHDAVRGYLKLVMDAVAKGRTDIVTKAHPLSESLTFKIRDIRSRNLDRLAEFKATPEVIMIFSDMLNGYRRVKAHALNVAEVLAGEK